MRLFHQLTQVFCPVVLLDWILTGLDGIRMDFGWIGSVSPSLLDGLDHCPKIQLDPITQKGKACT